MSITIAVFPGCGKTSIVSNYYCKDTLDRVKFIDADYYFFKRMFGGKTCQSTLRVDKAYEAFIRCMRRMEKKSVIFVNHVRGLESLIDHMILPSFDASKMEVRYQLRHTSGELEYGEADLVNHYDRYIQDWKAYACRYLIPISYLKEQEYLADSEVLKPYLTEFNRFAKTIKRSES